MRATCWSTRPKGQHRLGRGSNTDLAVPPLSAQTDPFTGAWGEFIAKAPTTGSGIGILKNAEGIGGQGLAVGAGR